MIKPTTGNLLEAKADALVNTVNCVGVMGKGVMGRGKGVMGRPCIYA